ncbi:MAG: ATP-binding protein, partial [Gaiellaceae bacterium]
QRTLRATIQWSHDLLDTGEQTLFRRLAVFHAGGGLDAVEDVCEAELEQLISLVSQSLVRQTEVAGGEPRYWMLETIREFAALALEESGEAETFRDRHLDLFTALAFEMRARLVGPGSSEKYARLERDLENLRAAVAWALERLGATGEGAAERYRESAVALATALAPLHVLHGRYAEAEDVIGRALALAPDPWDEVVLRRRLGRVLRQRDRAAEGLAAHLEAERLLQRMDARDAAWWEAWLDVKLELAHHYYYEGELDALGRLVEEVRPRVDEHGTAVQELDFLRVLAQSAYRRERYVLSEETEALIRELHRRALELGEDDVDFTLGFALLWRGRLAEAVERLQDGLASARRRGDALIEARCLVYQVVAKRLLGDVERVRELLSELAALEELHGYAGLVHANRAWLAYRDRDLEGAVAAAELAFVDWATGGRVRPTVFQWTARFPMLGAELERGRPEAALAHARAMLDPSQQPLPPELGELLERAVAEGDKALLGRALEAAAATGHA